jgi:DNA-binding NarL/FixJ family response regulator
MYLADYFILDNARMKSPLQVTLLDSHDLSRHGMTVLLGTVDVSLVSVLTSLMELEHCLHERFCDVLLLDDALPTAVDANRAIRRVRACSPQTAILVFSQKLYLSYIQQLIWEGARGFVYKGEQMADVLQVAIQTVYRGDLYLSPKATALQFQTAHHRELEALTARDIQILHLIQNGSTVKEIAEALKLDSQTVYRTRNKLRDVLGARTNEQIVPTAYEKGLL